MRPSLRSLLCGCFAISSPGPSLHTASNSHLKTTPATAYSSRHRHSTSSSFAANISRISPVGTANTRVSCCASTPRISPPKLSSDSLNHSDTASDLTKVKTVSIIIASFFGILLSVILLRCLILLWKRRQGSTSQNRRRSSAHSGRSAWVWLGDMSRESDQDVRATARARAAVRKREDMAARRLGEEGVRVLGSGIIHRRGRKEKRKSA